MREEKDLLDYEEKILEIMERSSEMIENMYNGVDFSIDAINFPSSEKIFYLECYMSEKGKYFATPDNLPIDGRTLH